jgi:hypothetical protein
MSEHLLAAPARRSYITENCFYAKNAINDQLAPALDSKTIERRSDSGPAVSVLTYLAQTIRATDYLYTPSLRCHKTGHQVSEF